jgi:hypothetical protein
MIKILFKRRCLVSQRTGAVEHFFDKLDQYRLGFLGIIGAWTWLRRNDNRT